MNSFQDTYTTPMTAKAALVCLMLICEFGLSKQLCRECECCKNGAHDCETNKTCKNGCIGGNFGAKCTDECLANCKTCANGNECTACKRGYYTNTCKLSCGKGCLDSLCSQTSGECICKSSNFKNGTCDVCLGVKYGDECNNTCHSNCGFCTSDTECSWCKNKLHYGSYCQYSCSIGCVDGNCNKDTGNCASGCKSGFTGVKCDTCSPGFYGFYCDLNCTEKCSTCISETNCTECKSGFYGKTCSHSCPSGCYRNCSLNGLCFGCKPGFVEELCYNSCKNKTYGVNCSISCHNKDNNCHDCIDEYEGSTCVLAIEGSEENKLQVIIVASSGAGVAVIILLVILVICLVKRQRRTKLSATRKCEENDYVQDMQEIDKQHDADESAVLDAQPSKPIRQACDDAAHCDGNKIPAFDNGYTMVNIGTSANEDIKSFEVCDSALDIKCNEVLRGNNDYAVVNKGKSALKRNEGMEEIYDTTHDNKKKKLHSNSNNEYAVLSLRSDNVVGFGKTKGALATEGHDLYDTAEGSKFQTMLHPSNDYAVFKSNNADNHEAVKAKANTLYDNYCREKTMQPVNNDYEFGSEDFE